MRGGVRRPEMVGENGNGAQGRNRTTDTVIFSHVLYQLSYLGAAPQGRGGSKGCGYSRWVPECPGVDPFPAGP
jgi:hypothetical protein